MIAIQSHHVNFYYGAQQVLFDVSLSVPEGKMVSLLGPNGSGKSTLLRLLTAEAQPHSGTVNLLGESATRNSLPSLRNKIGLCFQSPALDKHLTVLENLHIQAALYRISRHQAALRIENCCELLSLKNYLRTKVSELSGGYKRRVDLARTLLHEPRLLFLDEPTQGLDPLSRDELWKFLKDLVSSRKMTVFFSTHLMEEAELSDEVIFIHQGKIVAQGTKDELCQKYLTGDFIFVETTESPNLFASQLTERFGVTPQIDQKNQIWWEQPSAPLFVPRLFEVFPHSILSVRVTPPNLNNLFRRLTGEAISS